MFHIKSRRARIRLFSYTLAALLVVAGFAGAGFYMAYGLRMNIEYSYQRSLSELSTHINNIDVALQKAAYAGTTPQLIGIAADVWSESGAAKADLSQIQISNVNLDNTMKFISQVGDYSNTLSHTLAQNRKITTDERGTLKSLETSAQKLSTQLSDLNGQILAGRLTLFKSENAVGNLSNTRSPDVTKVSAGFQSIENNMSGMPSLIYDGPFSDNVMKKLAEFTKDKVQVSENTAKNNAAHFLNVALSALSADGQTGGNLPTFNFKTTTSNIYVSRAGGYVVRMLKSRDVLKPKFGAAEAVKRAQTFLKDQGISNMALTYTITGSNICTINFAYSTQGITCYPDLVKVGVALDNGEIMSFDATGYLMNHKSRTFASPAVSQNAAQKLLSPELTVQKASRAVIPRSGTGESDCWEFKCVAKDGHQVIDYIGTGSGQEEQILILLNTPGGTLTM